ncbi:hypothetical protein FQR65_LT00361 [Abscondita terminalis]|nr:hypothetical protein FQR65_LT00361 [Abscondita terminalis]
MSHLVYNLLYRLIWIYNPAFINGDGLLNNWDKCIDLSENSRNAILFRVLHGYFVPTNKIITKDEETG